MAREVTIIRDTIKINPVDTNKVVAGSNGPGNGQKMHFSADGGDTWTETTLPGGGTCCDPTIAWSSDGTLVYAATLGNDNYVYRSSDGGDTICSGSIPTTAIKVCMVL